MTEVRRYRVFIVGAGLSVHAGLPLGDDLFQFVREIVKRKFGADNKLESDLDWYLKYRQLCDEVAIDERIDFEKFMSYLDMEHYLGLRGSDTWSDEGNQSQLLIRRGIQEAIQSKMPSTPTAQCIQFCEKLCLSDRILTFNYDTLIEDTLDYLGIPYRLFPNRLSSVGPSLSTVDSETEREEIFISKLHGSIDWYDKAPFLREREYAKLHQPTWDSRHPIFKDGSSVVSNRVIEGLVEPDDELEHIYRVDNLSQLTDSQRWMCTPLILSPSSSKILYANPIKSLWHGLQKAGGFNLGLGVIGYSLPHYDEYARQALYHLMRNYTEFEWGLELNGLTKGPVKILDFVSGGASDWKIRRNYSFLNWDRTELNTCGFDAASIDWLMQ